MNKLTKMVAGFLSQEDGLTAVEYAVVIALVCVVIIGSVWFLGLASSDTMTAVGTSVNPAAVPPPPEIP